MVKLNVQCFMTLSVRSPECESDALFGPASNRKDASEPSGSRASSWYTQSSLINGYRTDWGARNEGGRFSGMRGRREGRWWRDWIMNENQQNHGVRQRRYHCPDFIKHTLTGNTLTSPSATHTPSITHTLSWQTQTQTDSVLHKYSPPWAFPHTVQLQSGTEMNLTWVLGHKATQKSPWNWTVGKKILFTIIHKYRTVLSA